MGVHTYTKGIYFGRLFPLATLLALLALFLFGAFGCPPSAPPTGFSPLLLLLYPPFQPLRASHRGPSVLLATRTWRLKIYRLVLCTVAAGRKRRLPWRTACGTRPGRICLPLLVVPFPFCWPPKVTHPYAGTQTHLHVPAYTLM